MISRSLKTQSVSDLANAVLSFQEKGEETSDITLICDRRKFSVHKFILAAHSDVFAAMFRHSTTEEALTNVVKIQDSDPDTVDRFLL